MAKRGKTYDTTVLKKKILFVTAHSFLERGYRKTTMQYIVNQLDVGMGSLTARFHSKEDILYDMVEYVFAGQRSIAKKMVDQFTDDPVIFYATETTLQLYMASINENMKELYITAYSLPKTTSLIVETVTQFVFQIFSPYLPDKTLPDFYRMEIASGSLIRGFMAIPCGIMMTMDQKVTTFLESSLRIYCVPEERIQETLRFVRQIDFLPLAQQAIENILATLDASFQVDEA